MAVRVYVVVAAGDVFLVPDADTVPMPLSILTVSAPLTDQDSVVLSPRSMLCGSAAKLLTTGGVHPTPTVNDSDTDPQSLVAVSVYVVVVTGDVFLVPDAELTVPMPLSILTVSAPLTDQDSVVLSPRSILFGLALKLLIFGGIHSTVTVTVADTDPQSLLAVRVYVVVEVGATGIFPDEEFTAPTP